MRSNRKTQTQHNKIIIIIRFYIKYTVLTKIKGLQATHADRMKVDTLIMTQVIS